MAASERLDWRFSDITAYPPDSRGEAVFADGRKLFLLVDARVLQLCDGRHAQSHGRTTV
jgi:hypothetical protein